MRLKENELNTLQRTGSADNNQASDFGYASPHSQGARNDGLSVPFPTTGFPLLPGERVVVVGDTDAFAARYGDRFDGEPIRVAGEFTKRLDNGGERLTLADSFGRVIVDFEYDDSNDWPGPFGWDMADGNGSSLELIDPAAVPPADPERAAYLAQAANWRSSSEYGGSPGREGAGPRRDVVINEVFTHGVVPAQLDWIELSNTTDTAIDVGGWYLSDSGNDYLKFRIPSDTIIPPDGFVVFDEDDFNPSEPNPDQIGFALNSAHGDDVWLLEADASGTPTAFVDHVEFGASAAGESLGRWPCSCLDTASSDPLVPMSGPTRGTSNDHPRVGPVVITEVHYRPDVADDADQFEFVEIHNPTPETVNLSDWRLRGDADFEFADDTLLLPGAALVVVPFDPMVAADLTAFRDTYDVDPGVLIVGGYSGPLGDLEGIVRLERPGDPPLDEPDYIPRLLEDEVRYFDVTGGGLAITRITPNSWAGDPGNWMAAEPTPGIVYVAHPGDANLDRVTDVRDFMLWNVNKFTRGTSFTTGDFNGDGTTDVRDFMIWNVHKFTSAPAPPPPREIANLADAALTSSSTVWLAELEQLVIREPAEPTKSRVERVVDALLAANMI